MVMTIDRQKKLLEKIIKNSLKNAIDEIAICGELFSEESLRYLVMNELSKEKIFGTFPNDNNSSCKLVFEFAYSKNKRKSGTYRPDIASLKIGEAGKVENINPLVIELKITDWATYDIDKCREYVNPNKGKLFFNLAAVVLAPTPKKRNLAKIKTDERKRIQLLKKANNDDLRILFAWIDHQKNQPELFWIS
jgi:hypothetical protein